MTAVATSEALGFGDGGAGSGVDDLTDLMREIGSLRLAVRKRRASSSSSSSSSEDKTRKTDTNNNKKNDRLKKKAAEAEGS